MDDRSGQDLQGIGHRKKEVTIVTQVADIEVPVYIWNQCVECFATAEEQDKALA